jgi:hypothetical protein
MKIGEIKKKSYDENEIPFRDMDLGDSLDIELDGLSKAEAYDYHHFARKAATRVEHDDEMLEGTSRPPQFRVRLDCEEHYFIHILRIK